MAINPTLNGLLSMAPWMPSGAFDPVSYGGSQNLGAALLAASGPSQMPQTTMQRLGLALQNAQTTGNANALQRQAIVGGGIKVKNAQMAQNFMQSMLAQYMNPQGAAAQPQPGAAPAQPAQMAGGVDPRAPAGIAAPIQAQPQAQPPGQNPLGAPNQNQIFNQPVGGMPPGLSMAMTMLNGGNMLDTASKMRAQQLLQAQQQFAPVIGKLDSVIKSASPAQMVKADPQLMATWQQMATKMGYDPSNMTDANVRQVLAYARNGIASTLSEPVAAPPVQYQTTAGPLNSIMQTNPMTGQKTQVRHEEPLKVVSDGNGGFVYAPASQASGKTAFNSVSAANAAFTPQMGAVMSALAERGVSLPTGMRSMAQQIALYKGLIASNPGRSPDEIADLVKAGKIDLAGQMHEITTAGNIAGKVSYAENELTQSIPLAQAASDAVPRGEFVPLNKLLQMSNTSISDPDLLNLKIKTQSVLNAYDMLAARGGTDVGKRELIHSQLMSAQGPAAYKRALQAFAQEAAVARKAGQMSMHPNGNSAGSTPSVHPLDVGQSHTLGGFTVTRVN